MNGSDLGQPEPTQWIPRGVISWNELFHAILDLREARASGTLTITVREYAERVRLQGGRIVGIEPTPGNGDLESVARRLRALMGLRQGDYQFEAGPHQPGVAGFDPAGPLLSWFDSKKAESEQAAHLGPHWNTPLQPGPRLASLRGRFQEAFGNVQVLDAAQRGATIAELMAAGDDALVLLQQVFAGYATGMIALAGSAAAAAGVELAPPSVVESSAVAAHDPDPWIGLRAYPGRLDELRGRAAATEPQAPLERGSEGSEGDEDEEELLLTDRPDAPMIAGLELPSQIILRRDRDLLGLADRGAAAEAGEGAWNQPPRRRVSAVPASAGGASAGAQGGGEGAAFSSSSTPYPLAVSSPVPASAGVTGPAVQASAGAGAPGSAQTSAASRNLSAIVTPAPASSPSSSSVIGATGLPPGFASAPWSGGGGGAPPAAAGQASEGGFFDASQTGQATQFAAAAGQFAGAAGPAGSAGGAAGSAHPAGAVDEEGRSARPIRAASPPPSSGPGLRPAPVTPSPASAASGPGLRRPGGSTTLPPGGVRKEAAGPAGNLRPGVATQGQAGVSAIAAANDEKRLRSLGELREWLTLVELGIKEGSHYQILAVPENASEKAIQDQRTTWIRQYHPDLFRRVNIGDLNSRLDLAWKAINNAVAVLTDKQKRRDYDLFLDRKRKGLPTDVGVIMEAERTFKDGDRLLKGHRYEEALTQFKRALQLNRAEPEFRVCKAWAEYMVGKAQNLMQPVVRERLKEILTSAIEAQDNLDRGHYYLAMILKDEGRERDALHHFQESVRINAYNVDAKREIRMLIEKESKVDPKKGGSSGGSPGGLFGRRR